MLKCHKCPKDFKNIKDYFEHIKRHDIVDKEMKKTRNFKKL